MSLLSPFLLVWTLLLLTVDSSSSDSEGDLQKKVVVVVVNNDFEVDYETASSLAGLAIECHDQVSTFIFVSKDSGK